jgi:hypothetical protein
MGRAALPRRRATAALITASLVLSSAIALQAGPAFAATALPPWTNPVMLADAESVRRDVVVTADGTAVALWDQYDGATGTHRLYAAARPNGSETWTTPTELATTAYTARKIRLVARSDGSVAAFWTEQPNMTGQWSGTAETRVVTASLPAKQRTGWSQPTEIVGVDQKMEIFTLDVVEGPGAILAATWLATPVGRTPAEVYATTRAADGPWTAPAKVSNVAQIGARASAPQIALDANGGAVVAYKMNEGSNASVMSAARPAGADAWQTSSRLTSPSSGTSEPTLATGPHGVIHLVWKDAAGTFQTSRRIDAGDNWRPPETAASGVGRPLQTPEPLVAPDGDITLVWLDDANGSIRTTTFDESSGTWSVPTTLSTGYVAEQQYDASIAQDGSVHVLWPQLTPDNQYNTLTQASLIDGEWTSPRGISTLKEVHGEIAASAADNVTAVWDMKHIDYSHSLHAAQATWPKLAVVSSSVPASAGLKGSTSNSVVWQPRWTTNTAVSSWTLTITDPAGRTVRTLTGSPDSATVTPSWNGRTSSGALAPNGRLSWTLKATQAGSGTSSTLTSGFLSVTGGAAVLRDFGGHAATPDGLGDLLTLSSSGTLRFLYGTLPKGDFETGKSGSGWSTAIKAVPFGDLNGDRCNDLLVRTGDALRLYKPGCGAAPATSTPYTTLAPTGWKQYDVLTSPGDITKDGRPDLIARNSSTGAVYLFKGTSTGKLSARVKLYSDWRGYKKIVGTGDLNGDGIGDLLAQDKSNELWRYEGTGSGTFKARVKVFNDWGASYNVIVGVGDLNGDGKADIVSRDTGGYLYRNYGNGKGSFGARTRTNAGFGSYKALF